MNKIQKVVIVDYGMGNVHSLIKKFENLGVRAHLSVKEKDIQEADKLILPGVGSFEKAMQNLEQSNLLAALNESVLVKNRPILGICLGMQLMAQHSEEGNVSGLCWFDSNVKKFEMEKPFINKVPHIGWNQVKQRKTSILLDGISEQSDFYFVHSYYMQCNNSTDILTSTNYEKDFVSAIEKDNIFGVQFHPEKSQDQGSKLFENFLKL